MPIFFSSESNNRNKGSSLVEILVVMSLVVLVIVAAVGLSNSYVTFSHRNTNSIKVGYLLEEGIEAVKTMRDNGWSSNISALEIDTEYHLVFQNNQWRATTTPSLIDQRFDRTFVLESVERNGSDDIVESGGSLDADTKKLTVEVSWLDDISKATTTRSLATYIADLFNN